MNRRTFIHAFAGGLVIAAFATEAQQVAKIARIGYLRSSLGDNPHPPEAFRQGLRDLGYVEGRNLACSRPLRSLRIAS